MDMKSASRRPIPTTDRNIRYKAPVPKSCRSFSPFLRGRLDDFFYKGSSLGPDCHPGFLGFRVRTQSTQHITHISRRCGTAERLSMLIGIT